jgi:hypothetical protein
LWIKFIHFRGERRIIPHKNVNVLRLKLCSLQRWQVKKRPPGF